MTIAFFCYYLWLFIAWVLVNLVYVAIGKLLINDYKKAKRLNDDEINRNNHNNIITKVPTIQRLQYFPLIFIFCWFWEILSISYNKLHSNPLFILKVFQVSFTNLYGLFNTILFFYVIYNYNSNHVTHRNPKTIGAKKKKIKSSRKDKKVRKKLKKKLKKQGIKNIAGTNSNSALKDIDDTDGDGVQVTNTTTTAHYQIINRKDTGSGTNNNDELSGATISLNVGNISVMSPTSMSNKANNTTDPIVLSDIDDEYDEEFEEDEYDLTDLDDHYGMRKNVTIGYNEDESDDFYSDNDDNDGIGVIEEDTNITDITPKSEKATHSFLSVKNSNKSNKSNKSRTNTSNINNESGFGLLSDDDRDDNHRIVEMQHYDDDIILHEIVDEDDGYIR